ncbi:voltage-gated sodium channel [Elusimicrobium simillimum]|uniref:ion transporter n=1 Tax=Elusimicrobium simillimum TaxID=3143438 RepID=UPI003C7035A4
MKNWSGKLTTSKIFEMFINFIIVVNCILIGVETYHKTPAIHMVQQLCVMIFVVEITLRYIAADSMKEFFKNGWNVFDLTLVLISLVPESLIGHSAAVTSLRIFRVFRVLRLMRTSNEVKLIVSVLVRSLKALTYNAFFFFIFLYLFAIIGVTIFKMPTAEAGGAEMAAKLQAHYAVAPNSPEISPDPYGTLHESMFTLFRVTTGEDWTDIRYNLIEASRSGLIHVPATIVTLFHVFWFCISAFLLLNLLVGAVVNNYQIIMNEMREAEEAAL